MCHQKYKNVVYSEYVFEGEFPFENFLKDFLAEYFRNAIDPRFSDLWTIFCFCDFTELGEGKSGCSGNSDCMSGLGCLRVSVEKFLFHQLQNVRMLGVWIFFVLDFSNFVLFLLGSYTNRMSKTKELVCKIMEARRLVCSFFFQTFWWKIFFQFFSGERQLGAQFSRLKCLARKVQFDTWCGCKDSRMVYNPTPLPQRPRKPGCVCVYFCSSRRQQFFVQYVWTTWMSKT